MLSSAAITAMLLCQAQACAAAPPGGDTPVTSDSGPTVQQLDAVSVIGQGEARQVQRISKRDADVLPEGTSPEKLLNRIPGVNTQSNDAFGANEESQSITLRGFNTTRLGYTLDGLPLGDNAYGNYNGLNISRALIAENFAGVELSSGIGSLGTASTSNLGGTVQYYSDDPSTELGGRFSQTFGSDANRRSYARFDTGEHDGWSAYVSAVKGDAEMWSSPHSPTRTRQFNAKVVYQSDAWKLTGFMDTSRTSQADYSSLSKSGLQRGLGWNWNLYAPDWNRALAAAYCASATYDASKCAYSGGVNSVDDAYYQSRAIRGDNLYYFAADYTPSDAITAHFQAYHHEDKGQGHWWAPGQASYPDTDQEIPISIRSTNYRINRSGAIASLGWDLGAQHLEAGVWYEHNDHHVERNFYYIDGPINDEGYLSNPDRVLFNQDYLIITRQAYAQANLKFLDDRLGVDVGVKSPHTSMKAVERDDIVAASPMATGQVNASKALLPQFGVTYQLGGGNELFASYAQNIAAFQGGGAGGPLLVTQASFDASRGQLKPEESRTSEGGWRISSGSIQASAVAYYVKFNNRLLSLNPCPSIEQGTSAACTTRFYNVGSVTSKGAELTLVWSPGQHFQWYNSASLNSSKYDDDYVQNGATIPTAGKYTVDTPKTMAASELAWHWQQWNASVRGKYTGTRYYTYTNDQGFGGFTTFDLGGGYDFGELGALKSLKLSANITNLTDKRYPVALGSFSNTDAGGTNLAFKASAPRQMFVTLAATF